MKQLQNAIGMRLALVVGGLNLADLKRVGFSDLKRQEGQAFVEYALVIGLIAIAVTLALTFFAGQIEGAFTTIGQKLTSDV
jgi:Flp pilus assembly pilin Flp